MYVLPEIAASFAKGVHFNTFGGNPVACAIASSVLDVSIVHSSLDQFCVSEQDPFSMFVTAVTIKTELCNLQYFKSIFLCVVRLFRRMEHRRSVLMWAPIWWQNWQNSETSMRSLGMFVEKACRSELKWSKTRYHVCNRSDAHHTCSHNVWVYTMPSRSTVQQCPS